MPVTQILDELCKVTNIAADTVKAIDDNSSELNLLGILHHLLELRTLQIAAGKPLVLIYKRMLRLVFAKVHCNILAAQLNLVLNTFAFPGKFGFAGIDDVLLHLRLVCCFHSNTSHYIVRLFDIL